MSYQNDKEAYCLANTYNLVPRRFLPYIGTHNYDTGMYEPDHFPTAESRCMVLAHIIDHTNIIVQYNTGLNISIPYHVTGTLTPDAADNYTGDGEQNEEPAYSSPLREFIIYWDGIDSWIIAEQWSGPDNPHWKRTNPAMAGDYAPCAGATGTATVVAGPE